MPDSNDTWSSSRPSYDEIYNFVVKKLHCGITIYENRVILGWSQNYISSPCFARFVTIGEYTADFNKYKTSTPDEDIEYFFKMKPKKEIIEYLDSLSQEVNEERCTLLYKICSFLHSYFNIFLYYRFHGWDFPEFK